VAGAAGRARPRTGFRLAGIRARLHGSSLSAAAIRLAAAAPGTAPALAACIAGAKGSRFGGGCARGAAGGLGTRIEQRGAAAAARALSHSGLAAGSGTGCVSAARLQLCGGLPPMLGLAAVRAALLQPDLISALANLFIAFGHRPLLGARTSRPARSSRQPGRDIAYADSTDRARAGFRQFLTEQETPCP
jgi:hypothetical protein